MGVGAERLHEFELKEERRGSLEVYCGSMFSGKSDRLIEIIRKAVEHGWQKARVFKPSLDVRYGTGTVNSHDGANWDAIPIDKDKPELILESIEDGTTIVGIDEAQFFEGAIVNICNYLVEEKKIRVIVAGLDLDFRGEPFGPMPQLMAHADKVEKLKAFCKICRKEDATRTQRVIKEINSDGEVIRRPANYNDPIILIGAEDSYEARCQEDHEVPGRPSRIFPKEPDAAEGIK